MSWAAVSDEEGERDGAGETVRREAQFYHTQVELSTSRWVGSWVGRRALFFSVLVDLESVARTDSAREGDP